MANKKFNLNQRGRFVNPKSNKKLDEVENVWEEQNKEEEKLTSLQEEIKAADKKKKQMQRELRESQDLPDLKEVIAAYWGKLLLVLGGLSDKVKANKYFQKYSALATSLVKRWPKVSITAVAVLVMIGGYSLFFGGDSKDTLGASYVSTPSGEQQIELPAVDESSREFKLFFPKGRSSSDYEVVLVSPDANDPAYTYLDKLDSSSAEVIRVTQQRVPDEFDLAGAAEAFQATSKIQIDEDIIFHGFSERGGIQSLIFIKEDVLFSVRTSTKYPDDLWANYYLSLER